MELSLSVLQSLALPTNASELKRATQLKIGNTHSHKFNSQDVLSKATL